MSLCLYPEYRAAQAHKENGDQFLHNVIMAYGAKLQIIVGLGGILWRFIVGDARIGHDGKMSSQHKTALFRAEDGIFSMGQHEKGHFCADQLSVLTHKIS